jgi:hypothetical protein
LILACARAHCRPVIKPPRHWFWGVQLPVTVKSATSVPREIPIASPYLRMDSP